MAHPSKEYISNTALIFIFKILIKMYDTCYFDQLQPTNNYSSNLIHKTILIYSLMPWNIKK